MVNIEYDGQYHCCHCQKPLKKKMPYAKSGYCSWECQVKDTPKYGIQYKTLKHYYGTVWWAEHWSKDGNALRHKIEGRFKDLSAYKNNEAYKIKKKILVPYDLYTKEGIQNSHQLKMKDKKEWFDDNQVKEGDIEL